MSIILKALHSQKKEGTEPEEFDEEAPVEEELPQPSATSMFGASGGDGLISSVLQVLRLESLRESLRDFFGSLFSGNIIKWTLFGALGLVALGGLGYGGVWAFNKYSERQKAEETKQAQSATVEQTPDQKFQELEKAGKELFTAGQFALSLDKFKSAGEIDPKSVSIQNYLGLIYMKKELYANSADHFKAALSLDDKCASCYNNFGYLKTLTKENMEALSYLKKATELDEKFSEAHFNLAVLYENMGKLGEAVKHYTHYVETNTKADDPLVTQVKKHVETLTGQSM